MTGPRLSWPLRALWAFVAIGTAAFAVGLFASVVRQHALDGTLRRVDVLVHQARWSRDHGAPAEALAALTELSQLQPHRPRLAYDLGVAHLQLGAFFEAMVDLEAAVREAPGDAQAWWALGLAQRHLEKAGFEAAFERARVLDPAGAFDGGLEVLTGPRQ